jgi:hypothetical protein
VSRAADDGEDRGQHPPLRVALLVDSLVQPAWVAQLVHDLQAAPFASLALIVRNAGSPDGAASNRRASRRQQLLYRLYRRYDDRRFRVRRDAFAPCDLKDLIAGCPVVDVQAIRRGFSNRFADDDVARLQEHRLDVALRFGFGILRGRALTIAKHGVWSYHHGDNRVNRGGPAGFWEVAQGDPVSGTVLQVLSDELDGGRVIHRSFGKTNPVSLKRNRNDLFWSSAGIATRKLRDLYLDGDVESAPGEPGLGLYSERLYRAPGNGEMLAVLGRLAGRYAMRKWSELRYRNQWSLGYRIDRRPGEPSRVLHRFKAVLPPRDRFWADPFPLQHEGRLYLFFEEFVYRNGKGHISVMTIDSNSKHGESQVALRRDYHLAYPFLFRHDDRLYMVPSSETDAVELYRCEVFPHSWTLEKTLLDVRAVDTTLARIADRWWLFTTVTGRDTRPIGELHLYHAESPLGPWTPHRRNPVKTDVRGSRSAGALFERGGTWYRPAQDCSIRYGYAVVINRIETLDEDRYVETPVDRLLPRWSPDLLGVHTFNFAAGLTAIDCLRRRSKLR